MVDERFSPPFSSPIEPYSASSMPPRLAETGGAGQLDPSWFRWGPAVAGGLVATAVSMILTGFGTTLGFSDVNQTWRELTPALAVLAGIWFLVVAIASAAAGGYLAGRTRDRWSLQQTEESEFRDGTHGLVAWAIAIILGALVASTLAGSLRTGEPADPAVPASSQALGAPASILTRQTDRMLRSDTRLGDANAAVRTEAGRVLTSAATDREVNAEDRTQLARLVAAGTGLSLPDAQKRANDSIAAARAKISSAHHAKAIGAFITAASLVLAAVAAWYAAEAGGRHRESPQSPSLLWSPRRLRVIVRETR